MLTPQEIEHISFGRATFGGYDMESVDTFLEPLIDDYTTLYKENALLRNKMKVLVSKLEEYRNNESSMKDAIGNAQKTCDMMVKEAEAKCAQMLNDAAVTAKENAKNIEALVAAEEIRVVEARKAACAKIDALKEEILACVQALDRVKTANIPTPVHTSVSEPDQTAEAKAAADTLADEISATIQNLLGQTEEAEPAAEPLPPLSDTGSKFKDLKFGPNYDPTRW